MKKLSLIFLISFCSWRAFAGNEMGNGADNFSGDYGAAWFMGENRTVSFCLEVAPNFARQQNQIRDDIQSSWKKWLNYVSSKNLYRSTETIEWKFPTNIAEQACDGTEDIHFLFGVENAEVVQQKTHYERPSAISYRNVFDKKLGWGKGWIWFCLPGVVDPQRGFPTWSDDTVFRSILLHEIGHVFGNVHVTGTIMDHALSQKLKDHLIKNEWIGKIDHIKELLSRSPQRTSGFLGGSGYFNPYRAFEWLMGRKADGTIVTKLRQDPITAAAELEVKDNKGSNVFRIEVKPGYYNPVYSSDIPVFKRMHDNSSLMSFSQGGVRFAILHHPKLGDVTTLLEVNMSSSINSIGPVGIKVLLNGLPQPLFEGFPEE